MSWKRSVQSAVRSLKKDERSLQKELDAVQAKILELEQLASDETLGGARRASTKSTRLSPQGRAAISEAAKKRWAKYRTEKKKPARRKR